MGKFFRKTFGGLNLSYYLRHLFFGLIIFAIYYSIMTSGGRSITQNLIFLFVITINTLLYPYSRFVYESVVNYIFGENVFLVNAILLIVMKLFTMIMCWAFAVPVSVIGLAYLYYYHTKNHTFDE